MRESLPLAEIAHSMPGRARLRISDRRGDAAYFASVAASLSNMAGVYKVEVAPLTGSVLIQHSAPFDRIDAAGRDAGLFMIGEAAPAATPAPEIAFDPKILLAVGFVGAALWQMSKERVFPPALTLLWYASHLHGLWPYGEPGEGE
jgi:hypothetical protein